MRCLGSIAKVWVYEKIFGKTDEMRLEASYLFNVAFWYRDTKLLLI